MDYWFFYANFDPNFLKMKSMFRVTVTLLMAALFLPQSGNAQESNTVDKGEWYHETLPSFMYPDSSKIKRKRMDQYSDYVNNRTPFPPKPRHKGALEVYGGSYTISGDVTTRGGWNVGAGYRWNLGYIMSMRADVRYGRTWGQEFDFKSLVGDLEDSGSNTPHNLAYAELGYNQSVEGFGLDNYFKSKFGFGDICYF